jgi:hypothetical protein
MADPLLSLTEQVEHGFTHLRPGCSIQLERVARQHILDNADIQNGDSVTAAYSSAGAGASATPGKYAIDAVLSDWGTGKLARDYNVTILPGTLTINQDSTSTQVTSSLNPSPYGQAVTFTATVTSNAPGNGTPTGTVTFYDGTTVLGTGRLSGGMGTFTTTATALEAGTHTITAHYNGDSDFLAGASAASPKPCCRRSSRRRC